MRGEQVVQGNGVAAAIGKAIGALNTSVANSIGWDDKFKGAIVGTDGMRGEIFATKEEAIAALRARGITVSDDMGEAELVINYAVMTYNMAYEHGRAYVRTFGTDKVFKLGGDNRPSTKMLLKKIADGIKAQGGTSIIINLPISTPALAWESQNDGCIGIDVTGSHLLAVPKNDGSQGENGIKGFLNGRKLSDDKTLELEKTTFLLAQGIENPDSVAGGTSSYILNADNAYGAYIDYVVKIFEREFGRAPLSGQTFVIDAANGAITEIAKSIFSRLGASLITINGSTDGKLINLHDDGRIGLDKKPMKSGAQNTSRLSETVVQGGYNGGFGFDGDADRVMTVDEKGGEADGDRNLGALALCKKSDQSLAHNSVVLTTMATIGLRKTMQQNDIDVLLAKVGDRYVADIMELMGSVLGGEQSGHTILSQYQVTGDGIITALLLACYAKKLGVPISVLTDKINKNIPYLGPGADITAKTAAISTEVINRLGEANRQTSQFYENIIDIIRSSFIETGIASYLTVAESREGYVKAKELYVQLWDANGVIKGWVSFRQSGTEPRKLRVYITVDDTLDHVTLVREELVGLVRAELRQIEEAQAGAIGEYAALRSAAADCSVEGLATVDENIISENSLLVLPGSLFTGSVNTSDVFMLADIVEKLNARKVTPVIEGLNAKEQAVILGWLGEGKVRFVNTGVPGELKNLSGQIGASSIFYLTARQNFIDVSRLYGGMLENIQIRQFELPAESEYLSISQLINMVFTTTNSQQVINAILMQIPDALIPQLQIFNEALQRAIAASA